MSVQVSGTTIRRWVEYLSRPGGYCDLAEAKLDRAALDPYTRLQGVPNSVTRAAIAVADEAAARRIRRVRIRVVRPTMVFVACVMIPGVTSPRQRMSVCHPRQACRWGIRARHPSIDKGGCLRRDWIVAVGTLENVCNPSRRPERRYAPVFTFHA
jgi:hypothetical protein